MSQFSWWNSGDPEIEVEVTEEEKSTEVAKVPPQFSEAESAQIPDKITTTWVRAQLPKSAWPTNKSNQCTPKIIAEMAQIAAKTPSKRGLMARFGLNVATYYKWERLAAQGVQPYALWHQCVMHGFSQLEEELLDNVRGHAVTDWKAAAWYLARLNREEYGEKQPTTQIQVNSEGASKVTINRITDDDALAIARIMDEIGALPAGQSEGAVVEAEVVREDQE